MKWTSPPPADSPDTPIEQVDFGMLRAMIAARLAASATAKASAAMHPDDDSSDAAGLSAAMHLLAGRLPAADAQPSAGTFLQMGHFAADQMGIPQGETHV